MPRINKDKIQQAQKLLKKEKVFTIDQVNSILTCSTTTARLKLREWGTYTSYNQYGKYYTMPDVPRFDENGLWRYEDKYFSVHGDLKKTFIQLVRQSESGLSGSEIGKILGLSPRSFVHHFKNAEGILREKHGGVFVHFSDDESTYEKQKAKRIEVLARSSEPLTKSDAIMILAAVIRDQELTPDKIMNLPEVKKSRLSRAAVSDFMIRHDLVKKTADTAP